MHQTLPNIRNQAKMAAAQTLPPIQGAKSGGNSGMIGSMKHSQPVHFAPAPPKGPPSGRLKPIQKKTKVHHEKERTFPQQPVLTKRQTTAYRNTYKHNLCVDMLHNGFHLSFCELFALIKRQEDNRALAGPESLMWNMTLLKDEHEKLEVLKTHLTKAETAQRKGDFQEVYRARFELARYFQTVGDKWLSDHFFDTCLQTSAQVSNDGGKMQAEGFCNVALAEEENGDYQTAAEHFEAYYRLASENEHWNMSNGMQLLTDACIHLSRIYTTIGERAEQEMEIMLEYLTKAYEMAKESRQQKLEGESAYRLGMTLDSTGEGKPALKHLNTYLEICKATEDNEGIGKACDAIAKSFARDGRVDESIVYLQQFVEVAEKSGNEHAYSKACHNLGNIYNTLGKYDEATKYFDKAYNLSRSMGEVASINVNRVQFGVAMAHKIQQGIGQHIVMNSLQALERLIDWKSSRVDDFDKPFPDPKEETPVPSRPPTPVSKEHSMQSATSDQPEGTEEPEDQPTQDAGADDNATTAETETTAQD